MGSLACLSPMLAEPFFPRGATVAKFLPRCRQGAEVDLENHVDFGRHDSTCWVLCILWFTLGTHGLESVAFDIFRRNDLLGQRAITEGVSWCFMLVSKRFFHGSQHEGG